VWRTVLGEVGEESCIVYLREKSPVPANLNLGQTRHCLTGQYLHWTKNRPTPRCWWCRYQTQSREHLLKVCPEWKAQQRILFFFCLFITRMRPMQIMARGQQKILWAEVQKETGRWKSQWKVWDLPADERCSRAVIDLLSITDVGRLVPAGEGVGSEVSEWEHRERREREDERRAEEVKVDAGRSPCSSHPVSWHPRETRRRSM